MRRWRRRRRRRLLPLCASAGHSSETFAPPTSVSPHSLSAASTSCSCRRCRRGCGLPLLQPPRATHQLCARPPQPPQISHTQHRPAACAGDAVGPAAAGGAGLAVVLRARAGAGAAKPLRLAPRIRHREPPPSGARGASARVRAYMHMCVCSSAWPAFHRSPPVRMTLVLWHD